MRRFIRGLMPWVARLHWKNWEIKRWVYPQLWYCMPSSRYEKGHYWSAWRSKWRRRLGLIYCSYCGRRIWGQGASEQNDPAWPGPIRWCGKCPQPAIPRPEEIICTPKTEIRMPVMRRRWVGGWLRPLLQKICGWLTGHEPSRTEWGYGGGKFVDRNCRWCDKVIKVPIQEDPPPNDILGGLVDQMNPR